MSNNSCIEAQAFWLLVVYECFLVFLLTNPTHVCKHLVFYGPMCGECTAVLPMLIYRVETCPMWSKGKTSSPRHFCQPVVSSLRQKVAEVSSRLVPDQHKFLPAYVLDNTAVNCLTSTRLFLLEHKG